MHLQQAKTYLERFRQDVLSNKLSPGEIASVSASCFDGYSGAQNEIELLRAAWISGLNNGYALPIAQALQGPTTYVSLSESGWFPMQPNLIADYERDIARIDQISKDVTKAVESFIIGYDVKAYPTASLSYMGYSRWPIEQGQ
jgi:hypothetical protein